MIKFVGSWEKSHLVPLRVTLRLCEYPAVSNVQYATDGAVYKHTFYCSLLQVFQTGVKLPLLHTPDGKTAENWSPNNIGWNVHPWKLIKDTYLVKTL